MKSRLRKASLSYGTLLNITPNFKKRLVLYSFRVRYGCEVADSSGPSIATTYSATPCFREAVLWIT